MSDKRFTWMHSGQLGAPQMSGASGSNGQMLQVLDSCLDSGYNSQTVVVITKTATTVTLTYGLPHGYELMQLVEVSGATDPLLNGRHRVMSKTTSSVTIDAVGVGVTTGTISTKVAPLDFESIFGSTYPLKRAYRSKNTETTQTVLYLDMSLPAKHGYNAANPAKRAMLSMCEDMTELGVQINSYTDDKNNYAANPNGSLFWYQARSDAKNTAVKYAENFKWAIVGNSDFFIFMNEWSTYSDNAGKGTKDFYLYGDLPSLGGTNDPYNCAVTCSTTNNDANTSLYTPDIGGVMGGLDNPTGYFISAFNGVGKLQPFVSSESGRYLPLNITTTYYSGRTIDSPYPNPITQSIIGLPIYARVSQGFRAHIPCVKFIPQNMGEAQKTLDCTVLNDVLIVMVQGANFYSSDYAYFAFDMTEV